MYILGIETSCDETAVAIVDMAQMGYLPYEKSVLANQVYSQLEEHANYGGVVPEIASRAHLEKLGGLIQTALIQANLTLQDIDAIAATSGPGLLGGLLVGVSYAKSLALALDKPFTAVNHLEGHALTAHLTEQIDFPYLLLLVSGGHCQFIQVNDFKDYTTLGSTLDDAAGECFDKVARMLNLPSPGGPAIEKLAMKGNPEAFKFPIPLKHKQMDFSFSGLKTAVRNCIRQTEKLDEKTLWDICASFQETVARTLLLKTEAALKETNTKCFVLAGGVAANKTLRKRLMLLCEQKNIAFHAPPIHLCTDNAVMIAYVGGLQLKAQQKNDLEMAATPRWPLDTIKHKHI